jgi:hypothetical protein
LQRQHAQVKYIKFELNRQAAMTPRNLKKKPIASLRPCAFALKADC